MAVKPEEKTEALEKLQKLLDVAGTDMVWEDIEHALRRVNGAALQALVYRVEQFGRDEFKKGELSGDASHDVYDNL